MWWVLLVRGGFCGCLSTRKKYVFCGLGGVYLHIYEEKSMLCASTIQIELLSSPSKVNCVELIPIPQHCPLTNRQILPIY